ncbi:hypothetical protein LXL04_028360 [Taraxacum kok-saghyz]
MVQSLPLTRHLRISSLTPTNHLYSIPYFISQSLPEPTTNKFNNPNSNDSSPQPSPSPSPRSSPPHSPPPPSPPTMNPMSTRAKSGIVKPLLPLNLHTTSFSLLQGYVLIDMLKVERDEEILIILQFDSGFLDCLHYRKNLNRVHHINQMGTKGTEPSYFCITASSPSHNSFSTPDDQHITISYPPEDHCTTVASHSDDHHITISAPYHDHWSTILPNLIEHKPPPSFTLIPRLFISRISYQIYCGVLEHDRLCIENNIVCVAYQIICVVWHGRSNHMYGMGIQLHQIMKASYEITAKRQRQASAPGLSISDSRLLQRLESISVYFVIH